MRAIALRLSSWPKRIKHGDCLAAKFVRQHSGVREISGRAGGKTLLIEVHVLVPVVLGERRLRFPLIASPNLDGIRVSI